MKFRWWNSFNILGLILTAVGVSSLILKSKFVFDPGRAPVGNEPYLYLVGGVLMFINAWLTPTPVVQEKGKKK